MKTMTLVEFHDALKAQGLASRALFSVKCPVCGTVQNLGEFTEAVAAATPEHLRKYFDKESIDPELHFGFDCIGRVTGAGEHTPGSTRRGCNWSLGGFLKAHTLEVITDDGRRHPQFEPATPEEAQAHARI